MRSQILALAVFSALIQVVGCVDTSAGPGEIAPSDLERHVIFLASDEMVGRDTGESGVRQAEDYIAARFAEYGLEPLPGRDGYFVDFTLYRESHDPRATKLELQIGDRNRTARAGSDFRPFDFSDEGTFEGNVIFVGYGITAPEHDWDEYADLDVRDKIVLVLRHEPGEKDPASSFDGTSSTNHALFTTKARNAQEHGARGMLLVTDPLNHPPGDDLRIGGPLRLEPRDDDTSEEAGNSEEPFLALQISRDLAEEIVSLSGKSLADLQQAVEEDSRPSELDGPSVRAQVKVKTLEEPDEVAARDVVAFLPGRDPAMRDEWIVIGGHHDHVGGFDGEGDTVYNGADDNASGTSGVLELAREFAALDLRPRRSLVFATFSAEEKGLLGSRALVEQKLLPVEQIVFMLNLDMIGRNPERPVDVYGDGYVRGLREIVTAANEPVGLDLNFGGSGYEGNSDHDSFYRRDVPFMFFFTGVHDDYHQLGDHAEKLDYGRMARILRVAYGTIASLAETEPAPSFIHHISWLGLRIEVLDETAGSAAVITAVDEGSRAEEYRLQAGDRVAAVDGEPLEKPSRVGERFRDIEPGSKARLEIARDGETRTIEIARAKPGYMGVFPGPVPEDQRASLGLSDREGVLLRQVSADGPCAKAGLLDGDIVIRVAGQPFAMQNLRSLMSQIGAGETVDFVVIREGERITIPVKLGERPKRP